MNSEIQKIMDEIGIKINNIGYKYLEDAVILRKINQNIGIKQIYAAIGKKYGVSAARIERAIRYTHETKEQEEKIMKYFNITYHITNEILILMIGRKIFKK